MTKKKVPWYTNSSQLPVGYTDDLFEALELQEPLQTKYTGGCIEAGNFVQTNKGLLKIEYICENFKKLSPIRALSYNKEKGTSEWDLIIDAMQVDVKMEDRIRIKAERGLDVSVSNWHPFFVLKEVKVIEKRADELEIGDCLLQDHNLIIKVKETVGHIGTKDFYDLTTKKNHNYLAGNRELVFIHNTVFHTFLGERITATAAKLIVKRAFKKSAMPYMSISPTFSVCPIHGYLSGEHFTCPKCGEVEAINVY